MYRNLKNNYFQKWFLYKTDLRIILLNLDKRHYLKNHWSAKGFKGTLENRASPTLLIGHMNLRLQTIYEKVYLFQSYF